MSEPPAVRTEIVGRRPQQTRKARRITVILVVLWVLWLILQVSQGRWTALLMLGIWSVVLVTLQVRPATVVDASGVRRPWHRRSRIPWVDVESVAQPTPGIYQARVNLVGGSTVALGGIPAAESAAVAALGGKPLARPVPVRPPTPHPGRRTDADIEADVARRARALAEERAELEMRNPRLRRDPD